jgi:two-component system, NarL family, response regulator, fimbrial Z protein, FimZ
METKMPRILLADDNNDARSALALLLETRLGASIVGEASTMEGLLEQAAGIRPDIVLLDWELPGKPETDRIVVIRSVSPGSRVIVISARPESVIQAAGADAFVNKTDPPEHIVDIFKEKRSHV